MAEELTLEEQVQRIRDKRNNRHNEIRERARRILNNVFLILSVCGVVTYFSQDGDHTQSLMIIGIGMGFKVVEILIRILG